MKIYNVQDEKEVLEVLTKTLEDETQSKIFTMRIRGLEELEDDIEALVVFENKKILMGRIFVTTYQGKFACRIQGNFI
jgi:cell division GTPase FtsZ